MQNQYFSVCLIEDEDDHKPEIKLYLKEYAPSVVLQIGNLSLHLTPERLAELGAIIAKAMVPTDVPALSCPEHPVPYPGCGACWRANNPAAVAE